MNKGKKVVLDLIIKISKDLILASLNLEEMFVGTYCENGINVEIKLLATNDLPFTDKRRFNGFAMSRQIALSLSGSLTES